MALEPPDKQFFEVACGYAELGMYLDADSELEKIDPFNRAAPEILALRIEIYRGLEKWELMAQLAKRLTEFLPDDPSMAAVTSLCHAARGFDSSSKRSSVECRIEISERGDHKIQSCVLLLSDGRH
jgi:hypothetical protein